MSLANILIISGPHIRILETFYKHKGTPNRDFLHIIFDQSFIQKFDWGFFLPSNDRPDTE